MTVRAARSGQPGHPLSPPPRAPLVSVPQSMSRDGLRGTDVVTVIPVARAHWYRYVR